MMNKNLKTFLANFIFIIEDFQSFVASTDFWLLIIYDAKKHHNKL